MDRSPARFVCAPALYPDSPFQGKWAFLHGKILRSDARGEEVRVTGEDTKGKWVAYQARLPGVDLLFKEGTRVRAYGKIQSQPDGSIGLAAQWIREVSPEEYAYAQGKADEGWKNALEENPALEKLVPFASPKREAGKRVSEKGKEPLPQDDFVPAHELKVEREYV